jgi:hypothetical protein
MTAASPAPPRRGRFLCILGTLAFFACVSLVMSTTALSRWSALRVVASPDVRPVVIFRYSFGGGGLGDCIKGMTSVMQLATLAGADFRVDFSQHPFGAALPFAPGKVADTQSLNTIKRVVRVYNIVDWYSSPERRLVRDSLFTELASRAIANDGVTTIVQSNLAMSRELSAVAGSNTDAVIELAERSMATFYESIIDAAALGTFWPDDSARAFRIAVHLREGDRFIEHATHKNDSRVGDENAMTSALANIPEMAALYAPKGATLVAFACGDTAHAREQLRSSLSSYSTVVTSPEQPVHIGYASILEALSPTGAEIAARDTVREHHTLASADVLFMLSRSGFSQTACSTAAAGGRLKVSSPRCFVRGGTLGSVWEPFDPVRSNYLSPNS